MNDQSLTPGDEPTPRPDAFRRLAQPLRIPEGPRSREVIAMNRAISIGRVGHGGIQRPAPLCERVFMLIAPERWYVFVPGVTTTGMYNQHFIRDIGLIQLFLGVAFVVGMLRPAVRLELWAAATVWLVAHALFHFWEVAVGICGPSAILRDFPGVTLPALIGIAATVWSCRPLRGPATPSSPVSTPLAQKRTTSE